MTHLNYVRKLELVDALLDLVRGAYQKDSGLIIRIREKLMKLDNITLSDLTLLIKIGKKEI